MHVRHLRLITGSILLLGCCTASALDWSFLPWTKRAALRLPEREIHQRFRDQLVAAQGDLSVLERQLDAEILAFQPLIEEGFVFRQKMAATAVELKTKTDAGQPLTGADLDRFNEGVRSGVELARRIFVVIDTHAGWQKISDQEVRQAGFTEPLPEPLRTKGTMLSLAGSLFLYDTYRLQVAVLAEQGKLRRLLNSGDQGYQNQKRLLDEMTEEFLSIANRDQASGKLRFCEENQFAAAACYGGAPTICWLQQMIAQSPSRPLLRNGLTAAPAVVAEHAAARTEMLLGGVKSLGEESMNTISLCFGNTVGLVETRKGRLWQDEAVAARMKNTLRPGDILLEKTPFRLTDTFIPGHWGHAAIWLGTEAELKELGLWDDPLVQPYQESIRAGRCVVEALRSGVTLNTAEHFLNIDDLAILRRAPGLDRDTLRHHLLLALRQVGKAYDFNFDIETTDRIVCSELVYVVYTDLTWPTAKALDRYTISPDNIALKALSDGPLQLVLFYHDGKPVTDRPVERMAGLMNQAALYTP